ADDARGAGPALELVVGRDDVVLPASAGGVHAVAERVTTAEVIEAQHRRALRGEPPSQALQHEMRAQVLVPERRADQHGALRRLRGRAVQHPEQAILRAKVEQLASFSRGWGAWGGGL